MQAVRNLDEIIGAIRKASVSTESRFVEIGSRLTGAVETLLLLRRRFETLSDALQSDVLRQATADLSQVGQRVSALAGGSELSSLTSLTELTNTIKSRVTHMSVTIKGAGMLATNAKIVAANIDDSREDLVGFATEISQTLNLAQTSLDELSIELGGIGTRLLEAVANQTAIEARQSRSITMIPARLAESLNALRSRSKSAIATAISVSEGSQQVSKRISDAVMALQIGDIMRQRIEHIDYALGLIADFSVDRPLARFCCQVQAAQLIDTADDFDHEMRRVQASLDELAADARDVVQLGDTAFGASAGGGGTFLGELENEIGEVEGLLSGVRTARDEANEVALSVSQAATRLVKYISTVRSLEADIRVMGLNTSLKCGRLGPAGLPLAIIAQELRLYAREIGSDVDDVMVALDQIVALADSISARTQDVRIDEIEAVGVSMAQSLAQVAGTGQTLATAFSALAQDGNAVTDLLGQTATLAGVHGEIGQILRKAAGELGSLLASSNGEDQVLPPEADHLVAQFHKSYTMDRERAVLNRFAPGTWQGSEFAVTQKPALAAAKLEELDEFFL
jgi:hypothetical protein